MGPRRRDPIILLSTHYYTRIKSSFRFIFMKITRMAIPLTERTKEVGRGTEATVTGAKPSPSLIAWVIVKPIVSTDETELLSRFTPLGKLIFPVCVKSHSNTKLL